MRFSGCNTLLSIVVLSILMSAATLRAQDSRSDTTTASEEVEEPKRPERPERPPGRLRISIDESGISVEGDIHGEIDGDNGEWVRITDDRDYREKGRDIVRFGESVFVQADEMIRGDLVIFGGDAIIEGRVTGNVVVIGGNLRARSGSEIKGDAVIIGGSLDQDDDAIIHGDRILLDDLIPSGGLAGIFGVHNEWLRWAIFPVKLFIKLILAFLVILFLRDRVLVSSEHLSAGFLKSFGVGLLSVFIGFFALLIVLIPLFITLIGIPLGILLIMSCGGVMVIAWTVFAYCIGRFISDRFQIQSGNPFVAVLIGGVALSVPELVTFGLGAAHIEPLYLAFKVFGIMLGSFAFVSGLGAVVVSRFGSRPLIIPGGVHPPATGTETAVSA
ncbi:MAG: hypothetical protein IH969_04450 [Candidatus Krumholzibacteriota bacterium]|nr:hypothetical protein [Candidatus Krumholzibacteriota bacterium]